MALTDRLTDTAVRNAKPRPKTARMSDGRGLYLEISPKGGKWWRLKYRFDGKERRISLGVYRVHLEDQHRRLALVVDFCDAGFAFELCLGRQGLVEFDFLFPVQQQRQIEFQPRYVQ